MGYKGLITLDLLNATDENRKKFYECLKKNKWIKIDGLTTAWEVSFEEEIKRSEAIDLLKSDLLEAQKTSKLKLFNYAIQLGKSEIEISNL
ncbi:MULTISPECIES: hypothetical protein [Leptospira]|uniref:Uncharacterized protein n=1 Tax=Leptospira limi TaxID=2950023 RepID=A0ABT3M204_9LEPT|nr:MULTISPECIES: hypothetical protein [Leptospira]MCW7464008.1 hypothetical protein [Leptospira limi]TGK92550.1 hypothetical protein EHQ34_18220 [Leptospira levettii]